MKRNISQIISKMVLVAILAALGIGLMFIKIPYPFVPWVTIDPSDTVILVAYALTGFWGSTAVAVLKTVIDFFVNPVSGGAAVGVGQLAAFLTSMSYVLGLFIFSHAVKWFKKGFVWRMVSYVLISLLVATLMTAANMFFVTPSFLMGQWATCFTPGAMEAVINAAGGKYGEGYFIIVFVMYFPFNLLKAVFVCGLYEILCNYLIFVIFKKNKFFNKYFSKECTKKKIENGECEVVTEQDCDCSKVKEQK